MSIYCTYITFYRGNKLPPFYIGSTSVAKIANGYHGSVGSMEYKSIWKSELLYNSNLFETKIISKHNTRQAAFEKELLLQQATDAPNNVLYINRSYARKDFLKNVNNIKRGPYGPTGPRSEQAKQNIRQGIANNKNKNKSQARIDGEKRAALKRTGLKRGPMTQIHKDKISKGNTNKTPWNKGKKMNELIENYISPWQGKSHTEETKKKIKNSALNRPGKKWTDSHKENFKKSVSGSRNNTARKINIYDKLGVIKYACYGNFDAILNENRLPGRALKTSLHNHGTPIFTKLNKLGKPTKLALKWAHFVGWYATYSDSD